MKNNYFISIIIPIYNGEKFLCELFDSIDSQIYNNYEVILIDDGSKDFTSSICKEHIKKNKKYKYYYKDNSGVSDTRNYGIKKAIGDYICFIDADDVLSPFYLSNFVSCLCSTKADYICCNMRKFQNYYNSKDSQQEVVLSKKYADKYCIMFSKYAGYLWNKIFDRNIIINNNIWFNTSVGMAEDMVFNFEYLKYVNNYECIENVNYYYRIFNNSESKSLKNERWFTIYKAFDLIFNLKNNYDKRIYDEVSYSYIVNLYQGKYRIKYLKGTKNYNFYKNDIKKRLNSFDMKNNCFTINQRVKLFFYKNMTSLSFKFKYYKENKIKKEFSD